MIPALSIRTTAKQDPLVVPMRRVTQIQYSVVALVALVLLLRLLVPSDASASLPQKSFVKSDRIDPYVQSGHNYAELYPSPPPSPPLSSPPVPTVAPAKDKCRIRNHTEYDGPVTIWGPTNLQQSASACCQSCREHRRREEAVGKTGCQLWVWCGVKSGCGSQGFGECWGKAGFSLSDPQPKLRASGDSIPWTSGTALNQEELNAVSKAEAAAARALKERRDRPGTQHELQRMSMHRQVTVGNRPENGSRQE